jgi:hypothetical protein
VAHIWQLSARVTNVHTGDRETLSLSGEWDLEAPLTLGSDPGCDVVLRSDQIPAVAVYLFPAHHWYLAVIEGEVLVGDTVIRAGPDLRPHNRTRISGLGDPAPFRLGPFEISIRRRRTWWPSWRR